MNEIKCLDHGYVALVETMGDDRTPAKCARTSYRNANQERSAEQDAKLTKYLVEHQHTTPLEFCQARFYIKCPMFVGEQILRHRTSSINKLSFRYVEAQPEFYVPELDRMNPKHASNKQGSSREVTVKDPGGLQREFKWAYDSAFESYKALLANGLAPEIARCVLPAGVYTEFYIQNDLNNWLKFLGLRLDEHAQWETRVYAQAILDLLQPVFPTIIQAWRGTSE